MVMNTTTAMYAEVYAVIPDEVVMTAMKTTPAMYAEMNNTHPVEINIAAEIDSTEEMDMGENPAYGQTI